MAEYEAHALREAVQQHLHCRESLSTHRTFEVPVLHDSDPCRFRAFDMVHMVDRHSELQGRGFSSHSVLMAELKSAWHSVALAKLRCRMIESGAVRAKFNCDADGVMPRGCVRRAGQSRTSQGMPGWITMRRRPLSGMVFLRPARRCRRDFFKENIMGKSQD